MNSSTPPAIAAISIAPMGLIAAFFIGKVTARGVDDHYGFLTGAYWSVFISAIIMVGLSLLSLNEERRILSYVIFTLSSTYFIALAALGAFFWFVGN